MGARLGRDTWQHVAAGHTSGGADGGGNPRGEAEATHDGDGPPTEADSDEAPAGRAPINITGMGSRYANVEEVSDVALAINVVLAIASIVAVGYLVFTAPSRESPQFATRGTADADGYKYARLGVVEDGGGEGRPASSTEEQRLGDGQV